jgi:hypothetical protein
MNCRSQHSLQGLYSSVENRDGETPQNSKTLGGVEVIHLVCLGAKGIRLRNKVT